MSSSTLSSFGISIPSLSKRTNPIRTPPPNSINIRPNFNSIQSMVAEKRDNLDHLQGTTKPQQQKQKLPQSAPIGLWDRFPSARTVGQMMETMERLMEDPLAYNNGWSSPVTRDDIAGYRRGRTPWEIKESGNEYKIRFDMPGMTKNDVKVWVEEKMLIVTAEKVVKAKEGAENGAAEENGDEWSAQSYGKYNSRIALPENVEFEKIKAEVRDGVLYIAIPKVSLQSKIVDINVQ